MVEPDSAFFDYLRSPEAQAARGGPRRAGPPAAPAAENTRAGARLIDDLLLGLGFVAIVEGLVLALAPSHCARRWRCRADGPRAAAHARACGGDASGVALVWLARA